MKKFAWLMIPALLLGACQQEEPQKAATPTTKTQKEEPQLHLSNKEKQLLAAKVTERMGGRPLVRDSEEQSGVMYADLLNLNDSKQEELYFLTKTPTGYFEEIWGLVDGQVTQLYSQMIRVTKMTQRSLVTHNEHVFLGATIAYEKDSLKQLKSTYQHVGDQKLILDEGIHIELPLGSNEPTAASKNLVTDEPATLAEYEALVKSYKVTQTLLKNEQGVVSMAVPFNAANAKLDTIYKQLTGKTYQVKSNVATISTEEQQELMSKLAALSLFHESRTLTNMTDKELSQYAAHDIVNGALRFFDVHFTEIAESVKTIEGFVYIGYNRNELDPLMEEIFGRSVTWQNVSLKNSKLPHDLIVSKQYIYLPKLKNVPKATLPVIQHLVPISADEFYVELAFYKLGNNPLGYTEDTFLVPERMWSEDMRRAVQRSKPKKGYALVKKDDTLQIEKIIFDETLSYNELINTR
ncbi:MAG TPA: hypothetical protein H9983_10435 [Candidatus Kurthia intestinigallinarum]|nr:hypothetical protein [Candidatus Kurthia intestinigallinarum]